MKIFDALFFVIASLLILSKELWFSQKRYGNKKMFLYSMNIRNQLVFYFAIYNMYVDLKNDLNVHATAA